MFKEKTKKLREGYSLSRTLLTHGGYVEEMESL